MSSASASELETGEIMPDWVRPIVKESLSERAYRELRLALMRGQLRPDTRLRLRPMSARFGISATPMREALLRLVAEKALALDARGSVVVPRLTLDQLLEIRAIRTDLEGRAAAAGAARDSAEVDALEAIHAQISQCHASRDFARAVKLEEEETVVFSWITWPDKATRDAAMKAVMADPRLHPDHNPMPFDGRRMIFGGFDVLVSA